MQLVQAYLGDIAGLVPDYHSKVNIVIKWVTWIFWFPRTYNISVYTILWSIKFEITLCLKKNNVHTLIKKYFFAKKW